MQFKIQRTFLIKFYDGIKIKYLCRNIIGEVLQNVAQLNFVI